MSYKLSNAMFGIFAVSLHGVMYRRGGSGMPVVPMPPAKKADRKIGS